MAEDLPDKREAVSVNLSPAARLVVEGLRAEQGVAKTEALARILEWYASLPLELRLAVLNRNDSARRQLVRTVIVDMAGESDGSADLPADEGQALLIIRRAVDRLERLRVGRANVEVEAKKRRR